MCAATGLLILVCVVWNSVWYTVMRPDNIYSLVWAPDIFLVSYLLLLTAQDMTVRRRWLTGMAAVVLVLPGSEMVFAGLFTGHVSGFSGWLLNDMTVVGLGYAGLRFLRRLLSSAGGMRHTSARYLTGYALLVLLGLMVSAGGLVPVSLFTGLTASQLQALLLSNLLAFFLFGIPVYFLWLNGSAFHQRMYQGQALLSIMMLLCVVVRPAIPPEAFNAVLWGGMFLTLLWRSLWCQVIVFGLWGPLICREFALAPRPASDYGYLLCVIIATQIIWLLRLQGDALHTRLRQKNDQLRDMPQTDALTGCLSRQGLQAAYQRLVLTSPRLMVGLLDINHFKAINETLGYDAGDGVLQGIAGRLSACGQGQIWVARQGGDEFAFLFAGDAEGMTERLRCFMTSLRESPLVIKGRPLYPGVSLGYSGYPEDGHALETLLQCAGTAMKHARWHHGQPGVRYTPDMAKVEQQDTVLLPYPPGEIIAACRAVFQPVYDVTENRICSVEALIRHPVISTAVLVRWAEQGGHLDAMLEHMITASLPVIRSLSLPVSLNVSPTQLLSPQQLLKHLAPALEAGVAGDISLEITETVAIADIPRFRESLDALKALGFNISLDDFGAGFAFFETLNLGHFDVIKLDRSVVREMGCSSRKQMLVQSVVHYARGLGMTVIAEGVETEEEVAGLQAAGISHMQGYYFSRPLEVDALFAEYG